MILLGCDLSPTSSGLVKFILDENLEIIDIKKLGFCAYDVPKKKAFTIPKYKDIISYDKSKYDFYNRTIMMTEHIFEFIKDVDYAAIEDYSFSSGGDLTQISEFCSQVKFQLIRQGTLVRLYAPTQIKQFAGKGNFQKPDMEESFLKLECDKIDIKELPEIPIYSRGKFVGLKHPQGISPRSDLVDSFFMVKLLHTELLVRNGKVSLESLDKNHSHVLTHTTENNKIPLIRRDFIQKNV
jgi:Holliday junction resolvasome RuvABC endonuclease subunit